MTAGAAAAWRDVTPDIGAAESVDADAVRGDVVAAGAQVYRRAPGTTRWTACAPLAAGTQRSVRPADDLRGTEVVLGSSGIVVATPSGALAFADAACARWRIRRPRLDGVALPALDLDRVGSRLLVVTRLGLVASADDGATWRRTGTGLPYADAVDLDASRDGAVVLARLGPRSRLACSLDGGATFHLTDLHVDGAAAEPGGRVWVGAGHEALRSDDGCATWTRVTVPRGPVSVRGAGSGRAWLVAGPRLLAGDGASWHDLGDGPLPWRVRDVAGRALLVGPAGTFASAGSEIETDEAGLGLARGLAASASADGRVIAIGTYDALRLSEDAGATWTTRALPLPQVAFLWNISVLPNGRLVLGVEEGDPVPERVSDDGGRTWRTAPVPGLAVAQRDPLDPRLLWRQRGACASVSADDGRTWRQRVCGRRRGARLLVMDGARGGRVWASFMPGTTGAVSTSSDGGRSWRRRTPVPGLLVEPVGLAGSLVARAVGGRLGLLRPGSGRWAAWDEGLPAGSIDALVPWPGARSLVAIVDGRLLRRGLDSPRWTPVPGAPANVRAAAASGPRLLVTAADRVAFLEGT